MSHTLGVQKGWSTVENSDSPPSGRAQWLISPFFKDFIYLLLERGEGREKGEKHQYVVASHAPPPGDLAHSPDVCPDWESHQGPFGLQAVCSIH